MAGSRPDETRTIDLSSWLLCLAEIQKDDLSGLVNIAHDRPNVNDRICSDFFHRAAHCSISRSFSKNSIPMRVVHVYAGVQIPESADACLEAFGYSLLQADPANASSTTYTANRITSATIFRRATSTTLYHSFVIFASYLGSRAVSHRGTHGKAIPPAPRFVGVFNDNYDHDKIAESIRSWTPKDQQNVWELSGLYEGDIMLHPDEPDTKNGLLDATAKWPGGVVPYYIQEDDFDQDEITLIKKSIEEYHEKTCLKFRRYKETDEDYLTIQGSQSGCWSLVGRHGKGQVLNLQTPGCVHRGVVVHEVMHALGFYHQQSAADRDEWVKIHWDNIQTGKEHNFNKYDSDTVTDYGIGYDYKSIMHYSAHAFSKNGEPTISPIKEKVEIGQRKGLSEKDVAKVQFMYKEECDTREPGGSVVTSTTTTDSGILGWIFD
ncbi:astacin isoform X2 [Cephus cinctus]|uniref:Metalloendopeptidase n=1 Tax=Cephus cinctus TaxID=211228 RepID=A0AAJ7RRA1_CEPCN|nr:astacin isoform X2 [Cephus cinctus]